MQWQVCLAFGFWERLHLLFYELADPEKIYRIAGGNIGSSEKVAEGDSSIYLRPRHTKDKADCLDVLVQDFNKMVEELGSIETLKTDFFSNVSHEFKTPLSVIYSNAQILQRQNLDAGQKECVDNIVDSSRRMSDLIQNMLKLNKLEKQAITPTVEVYDVCAQVCECAVQFEDSWEKRR